MMSMLIEGNSADALPKGTGLVRIPGVEGGIGGDMEGNGIDCTLLREQLFYEE